MRRLFLLALALALGVGLAGLSPPAGVRAQEEAQAPRLVETHRDWLVYHYGAGAGEICYILSEPKSKRPRGANRGDVFFTVTHRAGEVRNEVSLRAGYRFSSRSRPFAEIAGRRFSFYTGVQEGEERAHWAWMHTSQDEAALVAAMKRGSEMIVKGTSSRGTLTTDRYSLLGFTKALEAIDGMCG